MTTIVTGGSKCGKSSFAEDILNGFQGGKIYIAAMRPYGEEAQKAIQRHRKMRDGKGFVTVEKYTDIHKLNIPLNSAVLLECMGNLLANEMFAEEKMCDPSEKIIAGIRHISESCEHFVIITNQVGGDGITYPEGTAEYIRLIGKINSEIAAFADNVIECVFGIPIVLKGKIPC